MDTGDQVARTGAQAEGARSVHGTCFRCHALEEHADGHARWECVWVDQQVRPHASASDEWHIFIWPKLTEHTLLPGA